MRIHALIALIGFHLLAVSSALAQVTQPGAPPATVPPEAQWSWGWVLAILVVIVVAIAIWYLASRRTRR